MMDTPNQTIKYIQNVHAAEQAACDMLEGMSEDQSLPPETRTTISNGLAEGKQRIGMLEQRLKSIGSDTSDMKDWLTGAAAKIGDWMKGGSDSERETQDLIKVHSGAHFLHASYCALDSFSKAIGDTQTASLGQRFASQCEQFGQSVIPLVMASAAQSGPRSSEQIASQSRY